MHAKLWTLYGPKLFRLFFVFLVLPLVHIHGFWCKVCQKMQSCARMSSLQSATWCAKLRCAKTVLIRGTSCRLRLENLNCHHGLCTGVDHGGNLVDDWWVFWTLVAQVLKQFRWWQGANKVQLTPGWCARIYFWSWQYTPRHSGYVATCWGSTKTFFIVLSCNSPAEITPSPLWLPLCHSMTNTGRQM